MEVNCKCPAMPANADGPMEEREMSAGREPRAGDFKDLCGKTCFYVMIKPCQSKPALSSGEMLQGVSDE